MTYLPAIHLQLTYSYNAGNGSQISCNFPVPLCAPHVHLKSANGKSKFTVNEQYLHLSTVIIITATQLPACLPRPARDEMEPVGSDRQLSTLRNNIHLHTTPAAAAVPLHRQDDSRIEILPLIYGTIVVHINSLHTQHAAEDRSVCVRDTHLPLPWRCCNIHPTMLICFSN